MDALFKFPMFRPLARYAEFQGRSNRAEFFLFVLFLYGVFGMFAGSMYLTSLKDGRFDLETFLPHYMQFSPIYSLFSMGTLVPYIAVAVRRLHDTNRTGWWLLTAVVVPIMAYVVFFVVEGKAVFNIMMSVAEGIDREAMDNPGAMMNPLAILKLEWPLFELMIPWVMIPSLASTLFIFVLSAFPGTPGDNRFGPPAIQS